MKQELLPLHEHWRRHYREARYARHLSKSELDKRIRDIMANLLILSPEAKYGLLPVKGETSIWMEKFTHMTEEMSLRYGPYPSGFSKSIFQTDPLPDFTSDLAKKSARTMSGVTFESGNAVIKYGKREYMERLYEAGDLRLQPASFFARSDHNGAVRDDELVRTISVVLSRDDVAKLVYNPQDVPPDAPEQRLDLTIKSPTDYWLYCVAKSVQPRLFVDFEADACVIINDLLAFAEMLKAATQKIPCGAEMCGGPAAYLDPLLPRSKNMFVPSIKHFRYSYQEEYRFCWVPTSAVERLDFCDVSIGSLKNIASLIVL